MRRIVKLALFGFAFCLLMVTSFSAALSPSLQGTEADIVQTDSNVQTLDAGPAEDFSVIVLPDTQFYSSNINGVGSKIFSNQTQWVANNVERFNIAFVTNEGDIVDNGGSTSQWTIAADSMNYLNAGNVPWEVLPGNHDFLNDPSLTNYNKYFGYSNFSSRIWFGGTYPTNTNNNNFALFSSGGDDYLIFNFQYHPTDAVLSWANNTLAAYPNRRVIVATHDYMNADTNGSRTAEGNHIWNSFVAPHANQVFLVLCGHNHGEAKRVDIVNGFPIPQLLADYQSRTNGGDGYLRILKFSPSQDKIYVSTFSPYRNIYENDSDSKFELDFDMTGATENKSNLLLRVEPSQTVYYRGQLLALTVNVFNQANLALEATLTLTLTGPHGYGYYDFQSINVSADAEREYSFTWNIPGVTGTYVVEVSLVPAQLSAYDAKWLAVV